jgi:hypothetical protein
MTAPAPEQLDTWAILEVMGHRTYAGRVTEQVIAGAALLRIDVPETTAIDGGLPTPAFTKMVGIGSVYCLTPCAEDVARKAARQLERGRDPIPVYIPHEPPRLNAGPDYEIVNDDDEPFDQRLEDRLL